MSPTYNVLNAYQDYENIGIIVCVLYVCTSISFWTVSANTNSTFGTAFEFEEIALKNGMEIHMHKVQAKHVSWRAKK